MKRPWILVFTLVLALALLVSPEAHGDVVGAVGDEIELKATHALGVPLHKEVFGKGGFQRVEDGAFADVLEVVEARWHRISVPMSGQAGWVTKKYVLRVVEDDGGPEPDEQEEAIWQSAQSCTQALQTGARMERVLDDPIVAATWNIRWFPRGCPSQGDCLENSTDLDWLACTITWMGLDILGVQEILDTGDARTAIGILTANLNTLTGGDWDSDLQECGGAGGQHVGYLWNTDRLTLSNTQDEDQLNGAGNSPCSGNLRPGRYARVQSTSDDGVDFHMLTVHSDSGRSQRDFDHRAEAVAQLPHLEIGGTLLTEIGNEGEADGDNDIMALGDWNTMGMGSPSPVSAEEEMEQFEEALEDSFSILEPNIECSEYFKSGGTFHGGLLDHVVVSVGLEEVDPHVRVTGYCAVRECDDFTVPPAAYVRLSDHCPIVVELVDSDID